MIILKTQEEIEIMAQSGRILSKIMAELKTAVRPGITTESLDKLATELIFSYNARPSFKGYKNFPAALCTCINEQIVHAVPSKRILEEGDILSLDLGVCHKGYHSDMAVTVPVGSVEPEVLRLIRVTKKALKRAIGRMKLGKTLGDIGHAIQNYVEGQGFNVVRELCGHGIGRNIHEEPEVLNFGQRHKGIKLEAGMVLAVEPMVTLGRPGIIKDKDGFCFKTKDNSLSAHFEHTIAITEKGPKILTK